MNARLFRIAVILLAACTIGCAPADPTLPAPNPDTTTVASDQAAGMILTTTTDHAEITTADRLRVTITLERPVAEPVTLTEPDWQAAGWTVIDRADSLPRVLANDRIERSRTVTLEPFLDGNYRVPPVEVAWGDPDNQHSLQTDVITIAVDSVLATDDAGAMAEPEGLHAPTAPEAFNPLLPSIAMAVFLLACVVVWRLTARPAPRQPSEPNPIEHLERIAADADNHDTADVHRVLESLPPRDRRTVAPFIARCEQARFDPHPDGTTSIKPADIAAEALRAIRGAR